MELRHLRYFVMAAEELNISRASARLNVSQPAVSRQIKDLEEELDVTLFDREHNGLRLTDAGEAALGYAREVLRQSNVMRQAMRPFSGTNKKRMLRVGFIPTALPGFLANALRKLSHARPDVGVQILEMPPTEQEEALRDGKIDVALLGTACPELEKVYRIKPIHSTPLAVIVADNHPLAKRKTVNLAEFAEDTFLTLDESFFPGRPEMMAMLFGRADIAPKVTMKAKGLSELLGLVASSAGVAVIPADAAQLPHTSVVFLKLKHPQHTLVSSAAWSKDHESPELLELLGFMEQS